MVALPPYIALISELERRRGIAKERDLYNSLREKYSLSIREFRKLLMILELRGVVHVETIKKEERMIYLVKQG
ncbi:MAG: hypothetical protein B6U69_00520 [Thermofilum sp. ex4484_15]|nr:MAG: hypothetical protein B6U69_00520 [Thermofilum sp. ex4484_15]